MPVPTPDTPTPDEIYEGRYADLLPDMDESEFERLKTSMEQHGFDDTTPIVVTPDGEIVDGHHRYRAAQAVGVEPEIVVTDDVDVEQAIRTNLARRDHDNKRDIVVGWLLSDRYTGERSQREVAEELGVGQPTVSRAMKEAFPGRCEDDENGASDSPESGDEIDHSRVSDTSTNKGSAESDGSDGPETDASDSGDNIENETEEPTPTDTPTGGPPESSTEDEPAGTEPDTVPSETTPQDEREVGPDPTDAGAADSVDTDATGTDTGSAAASDGGVTPDTATAQTVQKYERKIEQLEHERDTLQNRVEELERLLQNAIDCMNKQDVEGLKRAITEAEGVV
jgi:hypothetical protein